LKRYRFCPAIALGIFRREDLALGIGANTAIFSAVFGARFGKTSCSSSFPASALVLEEIGARTPLGRGRGGLWRGDSDARRLRRACAVESADAARVIRYVPGPMAAAMVAAGSAVVSNANGKVKAVRLIETAATHARRIGPPGEGRASGVRFYRWVRLEQSATRIVEHHPRCRDYD
jgi:hypothetical protein